MCKIFYTFINFTNCITPKDCRREVSDSAYEFLRLCASRCMPEIENIKVIKNKYSKPYLEGGQFHFNISHDDNFICVVISDEEVGIDVQRIGDVKSDVVKRFLKQEPADDIENTYLWTDYEAVGKYFGVGIPHSIDNLNENDIQIDRFRVDEFCISVCHQKRDCCELPMLI